MVARQADEPALAVALHEATPPGAVPADEARWDAVAHAADLLVLGRPDEARGVLDVAGVAPPDGDAVDGGHLVLAAVHAALGADDAWRWLLTTTSRYGPAVASARLVAAAADARGDVAAADRAWVEVCASGRASTATVARAAVAEITHRPREDHDALGQVVGAWAGATVAVDPVAPGRMALTVADGLVARGDTAGARLLLRAAAMLTGESTELRARLRSLNPRSTRHHVLVTVAAVLGLVAVTAATWVTTGRPHALPFWGAVALWVRLMPLPGLSRAESRLWRGMRGWTYDADRDGPSQGHPHATLYVVVGILAAIVGWAVGMGAGAGIAAAVGGDAGTAGYYSSDVAFFVPLGTTALVVTLAVLAARVVTRHVTAGRARRRARSLAAQQEAAGAACRCWSDTWLRGPLAASYAAHHLLATPIGAPVPDGDVRRCPATGMLWLTGPLAHGGLSVALRGPAATAVPPASPTGFYL